MKLKQYKPLSPFKRFLHTRTKGGTTADIGLVTGPTGGVKIYVSARGYWDFKWKLALLHDAQRKMEKTADLLMKVNRLSSQALDEYNAVIAYHDGLFDRLSPPGSSPDSAETPSSTPREEDIPPHSQGK